ncbi:hypothetical protein BVRB_2g028800 [Beta vulgaris subsp. vulgaris]|nr:hypothetical protein BVRB_2g028800 [Beta vulgaris subsp. vulgaris]
MRSGHKLVLVTIHTKKRQALIKWSSCARQEDNKFALGNTVIYS